MVLTSTILVAYVGKTPDVAQVYSIADDRQEKIHLLAPGLPFPLANLRHQGGGGCWDRVCSFICTGAGICRVPIGYLARLWPVPWGGDTLLENTISLAVLSVFAC